MPAPFEQTPTGTILVKEPEITSRSVALYARVSSADQKVDLDRQIARLVAYASEHGWAVTRVVSEIGSGLNGHRPKLIRLLSDASVGTIIVEPRDRLMRFGFEYIEAALAAQGDCGGRPRRGEGGSGPGHDRSPDIVLRSSLRLQISQKQSDEGFGLEAIQRES